MRSSVAKTGRDECVRSLIFRLTLLKIVHLGTHILHSNHERIPRSFEIFFLMHPSFRIRTKNRTLDIHIERKKHIVHHRSLIARTTCDNMSEKKSWTASDFASISGDRGASWICSVAFGSVVGVMIAFVLWFLMIVWKYRNSFMIC